LWCHFANLGSAVGAWAYDGWRCMNCGDVVDALILENRSLQQETISLAHRVRPFGGNVIWLRAKRDAREWIQANDGHVSSPASRLFFRPAAWRSRPDLDFAVRSDP
jgi:hypothetical protein